MNFEKLTCALGWHVYSPGEAEVEHIQGIIYRVTIKCKYCGKTQCCLIRVPLPEETPKEEHDEP